MECTWREDVRAIRPKGTASDNESRLALELIKEASNNKKSAKEIIFNTNSKPSETKTVEEKQPNVRHVTKAIIAADKDVRHVSNSPALPLMKDSTLGEYISRIRGASTSPQHILSPPFDSLESQDTPFVSQLPSHYDINLAQDYFLEIVSPTPLHQVSMFPQIDDKGGLFLDSYINQCARVVCVGPDSSNYFLKTFYQLASTDNAIMYALAAWGGLFIEGFSERVKRYLKSAFDLIEKRFPSFDDLNKQDTFTLLSFYLVVLSFEVCAGDVCNWHRYHHSAAELIKKNGGLEKICRKFDYSNDIKFLISDVFFHDILSSNAFSGNSQFPTSEYYSMFHQNRILEFGNYGLDPLQGCLQPIYLILAEMNSVASDLGKRKLELDRELRILALNVTQLAADEDIIHLRQLRIEYYEDANHQFNILQEKLHNCKPNVAQIELIMDDKKELELHLTLFEVYLYTCQLCINTRIKGMAPSAIEQQVLLLNCLNGIDILVPTKLVSSLALLLLICGINCCSPSDRIEMQKRIEKIQKLYFVANVLRVLEIIQESWAQNKLGNRCMDWTDICKSKNWDLSVC